MILIAIQLAMKGTWDTYYEERPFKTISSKNDPIYYTKFTNYYIKNNHFYGLRLDGAAKFLRFLANVLIEDTTFAFCSTSKTYGGSAYLEANNSIVSRSCFIYSTSQNRYSSFRQYVNTFQNESRSYVFYTTVTLCGTEDKGSTNFGISWGDLRVKNLNSTFNIGPESPGGGFALPNTNQDVAYITISNNTCSRNSQIVHVQSNLILNYTNILYNTKEAGNNAIIQLLSGQVLFQSCCFVGNTNGALVKIPSNSSYITLSDCYSDDYSCVGVTENLIIKNNVSEYFINPLDQNPTCVIIIPTDGQVVDNSKRFAGYLGFALTAEAGCDF